MLGAGGVPNVTGGASGPATSGNAAGGVNSAGRVSVSIATGGRGQASVSESPVMWVAIAAAVGGLIWWARGRK